MKKIAETRARPGRAAAPGGGPGSGDSRSRALQGPRRQCLRPRSQGRSPPAPRARCTRIRTRCWWRSATRKRHLHAPRRQDTGHGAEEGHRELHARVHPRPRQHGHDPRRRDPRGVQGQGAGHGHACRRNGRGCSSRPSPRDHAPWPSRPPPLRTSTRMPARPTTSTRWWSRSAGRSWTLAVGTKHRDEWKRGDVHFVGRGVQHQSKNTGGKPIEFVIVAVK